MTTGMARDEDGIRARADEALAADARAGDRAAFAELWRRHAPAGAVAARQYAQIADADDLLSEASLRIFAALQRGGGPHGAFRPYLYQAIRNIALDWRRSPTVPLEDAPEEELALPGPELAAAERTIGFRAFRTLPERWQTVLWYLEIEGMEPAQAAPLLGLSPNAASALAVRAREGLKRAWLQAHVNEAGVPDGCRWTTDRMGDYSRGGLTRRNRERFDEHLAGCERCTDLLAEVGDAGGRLAVLLLPLLLGSAGAAALLDRRSESAPGASGPGGPASPPLTTARPRSPLVVAAVATTAVLVVATAAFAVSLPRDAPPAAERPPEASTPTPTEEPTPTPTPTPTSTPLAPPSPPRVVPPVDPPVVPPVVPPPVAPPSPAAPTIDLDAVTGRIAATGAGDVPGATIELWGTTTSLVAPYLTSPETLLASVVVAPDGTWTTPQAGGITPINVTVTVRQVRDGLPSDPVELISSAFFNATAVATDGSVAGGVASWQLEGWAGAAWEVREPGGAVVASGVFDSAGSATASVALPALPGGTVVNYDYGYVHDGSLAASSPGLTATVP
jgi:RNA polymerase sigma factor (sigma-70 family)